MNAFTSYLTASGVDVEAIDWTPSNEGEDMMTAQDCKKLANYVRFGIGAKSQETKDLENATLALHYGTGRDKFAARLAQIVTRFPKSIRFGV